MKENELTILEQYEIDVRSTRKVRDAVLCETQQGLFLIKEMQFSEKRLSVLDYLSEYLRMSGRENIDWILKTKEGELFTKSEEENTYFLKRWFQGKECDVHREKEVLDAVNHLAQIHEILRGTELPLSECEDLRETFFRHNREMKKVRSFMRNRVGKSDFELAFLKHFDSLYACADCATEQLQGSAYESLLQKSKEGFHYTHGDFNHHNVLLTYDGIAITNFEHAQQDIQVTDLYHFLRKVMEKNHWDVMLGDKMLNAYQKRKNLQKEELEYMAICLAYPEKFWKVANSYGRSRKVWIPVKNLEKLEMVIKQTEEKKFFLRKIFSFHLE